MNFRDCALGAVIAVALISGADAQAQSALPQTSVMLLAKQLCGAKTALTSEVTRICVGRALDAAGDLWALVRQL